MKSLGACFLDDVDTLNKVKSSSLRITQEDISLAMWLVTYSLTALWHRGSMLSLET